MPEFGKPSDEEALNFLRVYLSIHNPEHRKQLLLSAEDYLKAAQPQGAAAGAVNNKS